MSIEQFDSCSSLQRLLRDYSIGVGSSPSSLFLLLFALSMAPAAQKDESGQTDGRIDFSSWTVRSRRWRPDLGLAQKEELTNSPGRTIIKTSGRRQSRQPKKVGLAVNEGRKRML